MTPASLLHRGRELVRRGDSWTSVVEENGKRETMELRRAFSTWAVSFQVDVRHDDGWEPLLDLDAADADSPEAALAAFETAVAELRSRLP